jgi:single-stranded-DNA-specific exonuclease
LYRQSQRQQESGLHPQEQMKEWPADSNAIAAARRFLEHSRGRIVVASHNDVDGLAAAVIVLRALAASRVEAVPLPARRGEHVHRDSMRARIRALRPGSLVVLDMGSRPGPILPGVPTLVIDHHVPSGVPEGALLLNGFDREPVAPTSVLAFTVCRGLPGVANAAWIAALGAIADLGTAAPFASLLSLNPRGNAWSAAVSLLNAGRRAPQDDAMTALHVLDAAADIDDIVRGGVPGVDRLQEYKRVVHAEVSRCSRVPPRLIGDAALIRFSSAAQVHPLVATRWSRRLAPAVVIAANDGFLPGRVNFAVRNATGIDLLQWLQHLPFAPSPAAEYANGHPRATGGSLPVDEFETFLQALPKARSAGHDGRPAHAGEQLVQPGQRHENVDE